MPPAGNSFAEFFPAAPRVAKNKAKTGEQEKAKPKAPDTSSSEQATTGVEYSLRQAEDKSCQPSVIVGSGIAGESMAHGPDDNESLPGDLLNGVGSASSHTSAGSSLFSTAGQNPTSTFGGPGSLSTLTPLTNVDTSPERPTTPSHPKAAISHAQPQSEPNASYESSAPILYGTDGSDLLPPRVLMRDPYRSILGMICTRDPLLDESIPKDKAKKMKATYKEFGMDDAPPPDPRLKKGRLNYINTDFHNSKARLRHSLYVLRPYAWDPQTSVGTGPPIQIMVSGFDPLVPFTNVAAIFSSYGDVAESSNKMHPETGAYLGFATFEYRDSKSTRTGRVNNAIDSAKTAVKKGNGIRIGQKIVKVEYDPDGKKSVRKLQEILKRAEEKAKKNAPIVTSTPKGPAQKSSSGPPPTAPKGPSGYGYNPAAARGPAARQTTFLEKPTPFVSDKSRVYALVEQTPIGPTLGGTPYLFISHEHVPVIGPTIAHMKKRLRLFSFKDIRADPSGYYVIFDSSYEGGEEALRTYTAANSTAFFTYTMKMHLHISGRTDGRQPREFLRQSNAYTKQRSPSPVRVIADLLLREEKARLKKEFDADLEEEKRQRARNLDPVREAVEMVKKEMMEQLLRNLKARIAQPALHAFLSPDKHVERRSKLNIPDPNDARNPHIEIDDIFDVTPGTPNSRSQAFLETRASKIGGGIGLLPRIRKAKTQQSRLRNIGFADPFARARAPTKRPIMRTLHDRLRHLEREDDDSDDDIENISSARDTEEPESRARSRLFSDSEESEEEEDSEDEIVMTSTKRKVIDRDDDDSTEMSFVASESNTTIKKRKMAAIKDMSAISSAELFGITDDNIEREYPLSALENNATADSDSAILDDDSASGTGNKKAGKNVKKRKSKKQIFEEREAAKKVKLSEEHDVDEQPPDNFAEGEVQETLAMAKPEDDFSRYDPFPAGKTDDAIVLDIDGLQHIIDNEFDRLAILEALESERVEPAAHIRKVGLWAWKQKEIKALNNGGRYGVSTQEIGIEGYYIPNSTGSARNEGIEKILNSEKSKYLPHHIKIKGVREAAQERAKNESGKDAAAEAAEAAKVAADKIISRGTSRSNRISNRRYAVDLDAQKTALGAEAESLKFNQLLKRKKPVSFKRSPIHNWGLFAMENIPAGDMIIEYVGQKVRQAVADNREERYLKSGIGSSYLFRIDENSVIDATKMGGIARFINHSCMPNCTAKIIKADGTKRIVIYALRDIGLDVELTYDYKFEREIGSDDRIPCLCGTIACKGFLN